MMKRLLVLFMAAVFLSGLTVSLQAGETNVGGHVRMTLFDFTSGMHDDGTTKDKRDAFMGMGITEVVIYYSQELTDKVSVDLQPMWSADTGASPEFGSNIGDEAPTEEYEWDAKKGIHTEKAPEAPEGGFHGWIKAAVKTVLPSGYELSFGIVKPRFTWDYGAELFWEDTISGSLFSCNNYLGAMHETGFELYKAFECGEVSLPTYLYVLNGGGEFVDNNRTPLTMLHVEPEIGSMKFLASVAYGNYDDNDMKSLIRYALGVEHTGGDLTVRAEYAGGTWKDSIGGTEDATPFGYYGKIFYRVAPWARLMLHYYLVDNNFTGFHYTLAGSEKYTSITPGIQLYASDSSVILITYEISTREQKDKYGIPGNDDKLEYNRLIVGWRTTF